MENKKIICSECNTLNEEKYNYCKNCGNKLIKPNASPEIDALTSYPKSAEETTGEPLKAQPPQYSYSTDTYQQNSFNNTQSTFAYGNTYVENIDGIPYSEVVAFVGKKADKYMPAFSKMEITSSKTNWHWPCALLGFFLGPLGAALWYFYRKMYKHAVIFAAIGTALAIITAIFTAGSISFTADDLMKALSGDIAVLESLSSEETLASNIVGFITDMADFACAVVCGLFTHSWYKKHITRTIMKYRYKSIDPRYYQMGLMSIGGTSGGMLALGIGILILANNFASVLMIVLKFIGG